MSDLTSDSQNNQGYSGVNPAIIDIVSSLRTLNAQSLMVYAKANRIYSIINAYVAKAEEIKRKKDKASVKNFQELKEKASGKGGTSLTKAIQDLSPLTTQANFLSQNISILQQQVQDIIDLGDINGAEITSLNAEFERSNNTLRLTEGLIDKAGRVAEATGIELKNEETEVKKQEGANKRRLERKVVLDLLTPFLPFIAIAALILCVMVTTVAYYYHQANETIPGSGNTLLQLYGKASNALGHPIGI